MRADGLAAVLVSDVDYPNRVAHTLMTKVLDDFSSKFEWRSVGPEALDAYRGLLTYAVRNIPVKFYTWLVTNIKFFPSLSRRIGPSTSQIPKSSGSGCTYKDTIRIR